LWLAPKAGRVGRSASGPEPPFDVIAANGNFEPTLPIFHHAANVGFRETGKSYSDNRCHSCLLQYFVGCNVGLQR
jgi:hypothetical protein